MGYSPEAQQLRQIATAALPRMSTRISFLSLDHPRIVQGRTGVIALLEDGSEVPIPGGTLAVLMLGPGVSISTPALRTLANAGCVTMASTAAGDGCYTTAVPLTSTGKWACAQATMWADPAKRLAAARYLYSRRFGDDVPADVSIAQLRGLEGQRMKHVYRERAASVGLSRWRRKVEDEPGSVNANLNLANSILYGVAAAVCGALGLSPALGIIHQGASNAFLFDLADCYKTTVAIPAAFAACLQREPTLRTLEMTRRGIRRQRVLKGMTEICLTMLDPHLPKSGAADVLLDENDVVAGHTNYAFTVDPLTEMLDVPNGEVE